MGGVGKSSLLNALVGAEFGLEETSLEAMLLGQATDCMTLLGGDSMIAFDTPPLFGSAARLDAKADSRTALPDKLPSFTTADEAEYARSVLTLLLSLRCCDVCLLVVRDVYNADLWSIIADLDMLISLLPPHRPAKLAVVCNNAETWVNEATLDQLKELLAVSLPEDSALRPAEGAEVPIFLLPQPAASELRKLPMESLCMPYADAMQQLSEYVVEQGNRGGAAPSAEQLRAACGDLLSNEAVHAYLSALSIE
eukprot:PLAT9174.3.p1 GENE.PLAT9174.3~~PLAT9174.3.p1  ORF type:complete len:253 (-),score=91.58 PLAT9174.3:24-782(-)